MKSLGVVARMRKLNGLLGLKIGPGAAILPPEITKIHMDFARDVHDGHYGPRKFWRLYLPRLKYHNPAVSMTVNRTTNQTGPATMTIHYTTAEAAASTDPAVATTTSTEGQDTGAPTTETQAGPSTATTKTINMKHRLESEILEQLMHLTSATPVEPTMDERAMMQELEEANTRSRRDAAIVREYLMKQKREKGMLQAARSLVA